MRLILPLLLGAWLLAPPARAIDHTPVATDAPAGRTLVDRLRAGGLALYFRHADTLGMPCDRTFRVDDPAGQRHLSAAGRAQAAAIGKALAELGVPIAKPVQAGPVRRARDTAEIAFGAESVVVVDGLTADDHAGDRLAWVLAEHRRLMATPPPPGANHVLVGHRTPAIMTLGQAVGGRAFPEGAAIVIDPTPGGPSILGVWMPAPIAGAGFHGC
jgi:phosphohistidine phosphatase SixA